MHSPTWALGNAYATEFKRQFLIYAVENCSYFQWQFSPWQLIIEEVSEKPVIPVLTNQPDYQLSGVRREKDLSEVAHY